MSDPIPDSFPKMAESSPPEWHIYLRRPGSIRKSTSLWWTLPLVLAWVCIAVGFLVARFFVTPTELSPSILWILFVDLVATAAWVLLVVLSQREGDTELGDGLIDHIGRHEFWRARTVAWDLLAVSVVGALLVALLIAGPSNVLPNPDVPLVELAVLVATILLLATFSRYAAMAFNTDAARMVQKLEELSKRESAARTRETDRVSRLFTEQTDRIVAKSDDQIAATNAGFSAAAERLDRVAQAVEALIKLERESKTAADAAAAAQRKAEDEQRRLAVERRQEEAQIAAQRAERIRPVIQVRLRVEGILFHHLHVDVYNDGFDGVGLEVTVSAGAVRFPLTAAQIPSKSTRSFDVTDVSRLPLVAQIGVAIAIRDVDGFEHRFAFGSFNYVRLTGWFGRTKSVSIDPSGWIRANPSE